jgi:uncharacterized membrane protein YjgN (DUF898 family)
MENQKPLQFHASAGSFFVYYIITAIVSCIPLFGTAYVFNYSGEWLAKNALVNGRKVRYHAGYGETLKFVFINLLLLTITLGIYVFWFAPKAYHYMADHVSYDDGAVGGSAFPLQTAAAPVDLTPVAPIAPTTPTAPILTAPSADPAPQDTTPQPPTPPTASGPLVSG